MRMRKGWWQIRDASGDIKVRAWNGIWWTPLVDGWISSPAGYEPIKWLCKVEPKTSKLTPKEEWERVCHIDGIHAVEDATP